MSTTIHQQKVLLAESTSIRTLVYFLFGVYSQCQSVASLTKLIEEIKQCNANFGP